MNRYKLFKRMNGLLVLLGGDRKREPKFYCLTASKPLTDICSVLWANGWGTNLISTTFKGEIYTVRKPCADNQHQYHLRFYQETDGISIEGHFEADPLQFPAEHRDGVDLRELNDKEKASLRRLICQ